LIPKQTRHFRVEGVLHSNASETADVLDKKVMTETNDHVNRSLELSIYQALRRLQQSSEVHAKRLSRYGGLTPIQLLILQILAVERRLTASELAGLVSLSQASLSGVLDRLVARGMISRERDERDRRKQWLNLAEAGRAAIEEAPALLPERGLERFLALPDWERHSLLAALLRAADLFSEPALEEGERP
jgi:DNA-binding MarR family transcriptional regulator